MLNKDLRSGLRLIAGPEVVFEPERRSVIRGHWAT